jgi:hypothetical protein
MTAALAHARDTELSPELVELLWVGADHKYGLCCMPGQVRKNWALLHEGERLGFIRFLVGNIRNPWITDAGRTAIGAPPEGEKQRVELRQICADYAKRRALDPVKRNDPRTDFDYRSWKTMGWRCTLVFRQRDDRAVKRSVRVGKTPTSEPQFLGAKNSTIQPESTERFVLAVVPDWMTRPIKKYGEFKPAPFTTYPLPLDETDTSFTDEERETWRRLSGVCFSVNSRIRRAGQNRRERGAFGEYA